MIKNYELFMEKCKEDEPVKYDYGCVMVDTPFENWDLITSMILEEDLSEDHDKQIEDEPHVTVLYGLHNEVDMKEIKKLFKPIKSIDIKITEISCFSNKEFDVIKLAVESKDLNRMNKILTDNCEFTSDFPKYVPHITLAYLKPGSAEKYCKQIDNLELKGLTTILWSPAQGDKAKFELK